LLAGFTSADEEMLWRWVFCCVQEVPSAYIKRHQELFGGQNIWLTEVGLLEGRDNRGRGVGDSRRFLRTIFGVSYFLSWMRYVENVETVLFHSLKAGRAATAVRFGDMSLTANGLAYAFIEASIGSAEYASFVDIPVGTSYRGVAQYSEVEVRPVTGLFTVCANGQRRLLIVNTGLDVIDIGVPFSISDCYVAGGRPNLLVEPGDYNSIEDLRAHGFVGNSVVVKPFSVAVVLEKERGRDRGKIEKE
jgi:hypothetical protein